MYQIVPYPGVGKDDIVDKLMAGPQIADLGTKLDLRPYYGYVSELRGFGQFNLGTIIYIPGVSPSAIFNPTSLTISTTKGGE